MGAKRDTTRAYGTNELASRFNETGVIVPQSHPEPPPTPLERISGVIKSTVEGIGRALNTNGSNRSPSTVVDRRGPRIRPDAEVRAAYEQEKAAQRASRRRNP